MDADPKVIKAIVFPFRPEQEDDIRKALRSLMYAALIQHYGTRTTPYLHIVNFLNHQTLRGDRPDFRFPKPKRDDLVNQRVTDGKPTGGLTEHNITELNRTYKSSPNGDSHMAFRTWNEELGEWEEKQVKGSKPVGVPQPPECFVLWQKIAKKQIEDGIKEEVRLPDHQSFTFSFKTAYWVARKKGYGDAEIEHAIKVYASVLESPKSYWTKRYNFSEFMKYAYEKFIGKQPNDFAGKIKK